MNENVALIVPVRIINGSSGIIVVTPRFGAGRREREREVAILRWFLLILANYLKQQPRLARCCEL